MGTFPPHHPPITSILMSGLGKTPRMPDPLERAREMAKEISANRSKVLYSGLNRVLEDAPCVIDRRRLLSGLSAYHKEAMSRIPSYVRYPDAKPWVEFVCSYESALRSLAQLNDEEIALVMNLGPYLTFRGWKEAGLVRIADQERCRAAFLPATDAGPVLIKNVDDPITNWIPDAPLKPKRPLKDFWWEQVHWVVDGVGSGLHIDIEPEEIFPLPVLQMLGHYANDTPAIVEFLRAYSRFFGGRNLLVIDRKFRAVAIEKCSRSYFEVFKPGPTGECHISGMVCRNPDSPQGKHQKAMRDMFRMLYRLPDNGPDSAFWNFCDDLERKLARELNFLGRNPGFEDVVNLFVLPWPEGLRKDGIQIHPDMRVADYTLMTYATVFEKRTYYRWQRSSAENCALWPRAPEICRYTG